MPDKQPMLAARAANTVSDSMMWELCVGYASEARVLLVDTTKAADGIRR